MRNSLPLRGFDRSSPDSRAAAVDNYCYSNARSPGQWLSSGLLRRKRRFARRGGNRPWWRRRCLGPQLLLRILGNQAGHLFLGCLKLVGDCCIVAVDLFLRCFELLADFGIVADYFVLAGLELLHTGLELLHTGLELPDVLLDDGKESA